MKDKNMERLLAEKQVKRIELPIVKRRVPQNCGDYLRDDVARKHINALNRNMFLYRFFDTRFELSRGEVFLAYFQYECGCEIDGPHFVVALQTSSRLNQLVTVVPLSSYKKEREINRSSEIYIGQIPGVANGKETIAVINQLKTIDKRRLYDKASVMNFNNRARNKEVKDYEEISVQNKYIYRLSVEQFNRIFKAVLDYLRYGYIDADEK